MWLSSTTALARSSLEMSSAGASIWRGVGRGGVAGIPAVDTMKEIDGDGHVVATPDRSRIWHAQTPQAFPLGVIMDAYRRAFTEDFPPTDDAALVERVGGRVMMVESSGDNLKITRPEDLEMAELMLARGEG